MVHATTSVRGQILAAPGTMTEGVHSGTPFNSKLLHSLDESRNVIDLADSNNGCDDYINIMMTPFLSRGDFHPHHDHGNLRDGVSANGTHPCTDLIQDSLDYLTSYLLSRRRNLSQKNSDPAVVMSKIPNKAICCIFEGIVLRIGGDCQMEETPDTSIGIIGFNFHQLFRY